MLRYLLLAVCLSATVFTSRCLAEPQAETVHAAQFRVVETNKAHQLLDGDHVVGTFAPYKSEAVAFRDRIKPVKGGVYEWTRVFSLKSGQTRQSVRLTMDFVAAYKSNYTMIPGILYNGNWNDKRSVYKGYSHKGTPLSFAWHRTTIPGATYSEGSAYSVSVFLY